MPRRGVRTYSSEALRFRRLFLGSLCAAAVLGALNGVALALASSPSEGKAVAARAPATAPAGKRAAAPRHALAAPQAGLWTFRGNPERSLSGVGPIPRREPRVLWRYPESGGMCAPSTDETGISTWCGLGWTGQPSVVPRAGGRVEVRFGAFDRAYHFLDGETGKRVRASLPTGDLAKGSATSDPDGFPLFYAGSRDNKLRIVALDRGRPTVLWTLDSRDAPVVWNDDWDGAPLIVRGHLLVGGENGWFYVIRLNRSYGPGGKVRVRPRIVARVAGWDEQLLAARPDRAFSIESSVAYSRGVAYFANSAGLVQGWDLRQTFAHGKRPRRVFRFWMGDDTDATLVIDDKGYLYAASQVERFSARSREVGQLVKLDPRRPRDPIVWSVPLTRVGWQGKAGVWSTPAVDRGTVYVTTNAGELLGVSRRTGRVRWRLELPGHLWSSPVVAGGVLLQGDCAGTLHAFDVRNERREPRRLWSVRLGGCIEATPAVWRGRIWVGTRGGALYAIG
ncbi:MAG: PQQ-binding-like beta-propeller repeat protein [Thermoleophilia bacterium]|nr:PQQ-binding-like beta-propeller repeat protein [Thermoleophilia bacterium]